MVTFICMDGLGGLPLLTFGILKWLSEFIGYRVVLVNIKGIVTHEDRVQRVMEAYRAELGQGRKIFLVGQSAGGDAVMRVAERLTVGHQGLTGVIIIDPAMPFGYWFMTWKLFKGMVCQWSSLLMARTIYSTEAQYRSLIEPVAHYLLQPAVENRQPFPGPESFKLAFCPAFIAKHDFPILYIYGELDGWVSARAHVKHIASLKAMGCDVAVLMVKGSGHIPLLSDRREEVVAAIHQWVKKFLSESRTTH